MPRRRLENVLFLCALAVGALTLWRTAFIESHWDEDDCVAVGWLLSKGWRLYRDVFSHHMPLDYLPSWLVARFFGPAPELCRGLMLCLWAAGCAAVLRISRPRGRAAAAILFTFLSAQWLTYWYGQMMLVENLWSWAVVGLLALADGGELSARASAAAGLLTGVVACASLTAWPAAALLGLFFLARSSRRAPFAAGFSTFFVVFIAWAALHTDLRLWYADAVRFNAVSYAAFNGLTAGAPAAGFFSGALKADLSYFAATFSWASLEQFFEGLLRLAALTWPLEALARRRWAEGLWRAALVFSLKLRPEHFRLAVPHHSAPFFLAAAWLLAGQVVAARAFLARIDRRWAWGWTAGCAALLVATLVPTTLATLSLRRYRDETPDAALAAAQAIRQGTDPADPIAVFPSFSRLYVETGRVPAVPNVFYFPWQAAWPEQHERTLAALKSNAPKMVVMRETAIWGIPWHDYGADIDGWVRANYFETASPGLWVRRDYAAELSRRCPSCALKPAKKA